jgi:oxygen-independent coproporphyrinogen-3 oxidase
VTALCEEILQTPKQVQSYLVTSIFFGGGTPSLLTPKQLHRIMEAIRLVFCVSPTAEITMEVNPGTWNREKIQGSIQAGVHRISIGLQSVEDTELLMLGRIHTFAQFREMYELARECGYTNINVDLISAIPGQTPQSWRRSLQQVLALSPEHLSAYSLILEEDTPLYDACLEREFVQKHPLPSEDAERQMYWDTKEILAQAGYERYEISNYAKSGFACQHNLGYWERVPYLGFGLGAASLIPKELLLEEPRGEGSVHDGQMARYTNPETMDAYRQSYQEKYLAPLLTKNEEIEETMFLGLRKMEGVSKAAFSSQFGICCTEQYASVISKLQKLHLIEETPTHLRLTDAGIDVSNSIFVEFLLDEEKIK